MLSEDIDQNSSPTCSCEEEILVEYWEEGKLVRVHVGGCCTFSPMESGSSIPRIESKFMPRRIGRNG